jgi:hypothetical protein
VTRSLSAACAKRPRSRRKFPCAASPASGVLLRTLLPGRDCGAEEVVQAFLFHVRGFREGDITMLLAGAFQEPIRIRQRSSMNDSELHSLFAWDARANETAVAGPKPYPITRPGRSSSSRAPGIAARTIARNRRPSSLTAAGYSLKNSRTSLSDCFKPGRHPRGCAESISRPASPWPLCWRARRRCNAPRKNPA